MLEGRELDIAVARALGYTVVETDFYDVNEGLAFSGQTIICRNRNRNRDGALWVWQAMFGNVTQNDVWAPHCRHDQGGPLIETHHISIIWNGSEWLARHESKGVAGWKWAEGAPNQAFGSTMLIAGCRVLAMGGGLYQDEGVFVGG